MFIKRDGQFFDEDPSVDVVEFPEEMEEAEVYRRYAVEIWSDSPAKEGAKFLAEEMFELYPSDEQLLWCFAKYGDCILRIKEECYLGVPNYSVFRPEKTKP